MSFTFRYTCDYYTINKNYGKTHKIKAAKKQKIIKTFLAAK